MTRSAYFILEALFEVNETPLAAQSPAVIAYNLDYSQENVTRKLHELNKAGLVEKIESGRYQVTDTGQAYLAGDLDVRELE